MARTRLSLLVSLLGAGCGAQQMAGGDASPPDLAPASGTHRLWLASTEFGDYVLQEMPPHPF